MVDVDAVQAATFEVAGMALQRFSEYTMIAAQTRRDVARRVVGAVWTATTFSRP